MLVLNVIDADGRGVCMLEDVILDLGVKTKDTYCSVYHHLFARHSPLLGRTLARHITHGRG